MLAVSLHQAFFGTSGREGRYYNPGLLPCNGKLTGCVNLAALLGVFCSGYADGLGFVVAAAGLPARE